MSDDTTRHITQRTDVEASRVYAFASDPVNLRRWAAGLAVPALGDVTVEFAPDNEFGVLDHVVRLPSGEQVYNPMRVIPAGADEQWCEVVFTLRRRPGMTDEQFEADAAAVAADLGALRRLVEDSR